MQKTKLGQVAEIKLSNVDKKTVESEIPVNLANYVDVYHNWQLKNDLVKSFMKATVKQNEFDNFQLKKGYVAITKDSETAEDIGKSTYIAEDLDNTVLGYHTVLIKPNEQELLGEYLNAYFHTQKLRSYFKYNVSGSGQRVTLQIDTIKNIPLEIPSLSTQIAISRVLNSLNNKISNNRKINSELEKIARAIYDYWFIGFNFPNKKGQPYYQNGGLMTYSNDFKRNIPVGWEVTNLKKVAEMYQPEIISAKKFSTSGKFLVYGANGVIGKYDKYNHKNSEFTITVRGNTSGNLNFTMPKSWITGNSMVVRPVDSKLSRLYLYYYFLTTQSAMKVISGSAQPQITRSNLETLSIIIPDKKTLSKFTEQVLPIFTQIQQNNRESAELEQIRDWLLPMLLNGQIVVNNCSSKLPVEK